MKRFASILLLGVLIFSLTGCQSKDYVAKVNDEVITRDELDNKVVQIAASEGLNLEDPQYASFKDYFDLQVLNQIIDEKLLMKQAEKKNIKADSKVVDEKLAQIKGQFASDKEYKEYYEKQFKMSEKEIKQVVTDSIIMEKLFAEITKDVKITTDLQTYYNENKEEFNQPEKIKAKHILVETEKEAKEILKQVTENKADMEKLAQEKSIDPSAKENKGNLGYFPRGSMVPEFEEVAFALNAGEIAKEPVKSQFGYHIIQVEDKVAAKQLSFEEAKGQIEDKLLTGAKNNKVMEYLTEVRKEAKIENKLEKEVNEKLEEEKKTQTNQPVDETKSDDTKADDKVKDKEPEEKK
ncbi:peptidyl-prolyl cis-trans isomerase C [Desulfonispora thiosulfatigenes DSM 11270]|uniref:peptidylprolyl isomerase n=1 Tax=Desulfonispora thiosulfatigenes DSM 11270 TaxID=656914 RepID=A0A1W1V0F1_DESTI|nr:peptidylprolyl isomerase [Desulfonispora thiosulfatigenes]SMB86484.1 peptidyl-prolyl cis-trans isomerase C [Desulfonispora thiosulfatigenes DSM 11270]